MAEDEGAVRIRKVPEKFRKKTAKNEDILAWARGELNGQEPDLGQETLGMIKNGDLAEVVLKPRQHGFFLPGGRFVEAFDYAPDFGSDLDEAEEKWEGEEQDRAWVDEENKAFNKTEFGKHPRIGHVLWEHGRRIETYAKEHDRSVSRLLRLLERRKLPDGYARHTHQTALDFYRWKPSLHVSDSLLDWKWERIDAILRFSNSNQIRDHVREIVETSELGRVRDDLLSRLLGIKTRSRDLFLSPQDHEVLERRKSVV